MHIVARLPLNSSCRPDVAALRADGIPEASGTAWYFDDTAERYNRLTVSTRARLTGGATTR